MGVDATMSFPLLSCLAAGVVVVYYARRRSRRRNLPPGPPGWPILGNVFDTPLTEPWRAYKSLGKKYGDIFHLRLLTQDIIILNSYEAIRDLLDLRSQNYSDRPHIPGNSLVDFGSWGTGFLPYGEKWKAHRKLFQYTLRSERMPLYQSMQLMKTRQLLQNMSDSPSDFERHFRSFTTSIAMAATYDYHPAPRDDPMVSNLKVLAGVGVSLLGPAYTVLFTAFPILMYLPTWFPGATWQRTADTGRKIVNWWLTAPVQHVQDKMAGGSIGPCLVGDALARMDGGRDEAEHAIRMINGAAVSSLLGASDTADSTLQSFVLAMVLHPDVQRHAQAEIQAVVGSERLPGFSDRPNMPYLEAVYREALRYHPALPFAIVRRAVNDDIYRGYTIPKGVTIIPNLWGVAHDGTRYPDPHTFNPGRFFGDDGKLNDDTVSFVYGFGRRACAGRALAESTVWLAIVNLLALFSFEAPLGEHGKPVEIEPRFITGLISCPEPFPVHVTMRMDAQKIAGLLGTDNDIDELATTGWSE